MARRSLRESSKIPEISLIRAVCTRGAALGLVLLALAIPARADPPVRMAAASSDAALPAVSARPPALRPPDPAASVLWYPGFARDPALRAEWERAVEHERAYEYLEAERIFESLISTAPDEPHTYWRIARDYAWLAELAPPSASDERVRYGKLAMTWADRGLEKDPRCGECCFYKYAGMGRVAIANGILSSMAWLKQISQTLDQCMQAPPSFVHEPWNPELGNFYYAAAVFYRLLPDSRLLELATGIRGDPHRSLELSRRAVALADQRIDYNVGLAASLLCVGEEDGRQDLVREGRAVLQRVDGLPELMPTDPLDRRAARRMLDQPQSACGYSRDAWNDGELPLARRGQ